jgi:murein peptide amidase A
MRWPKLIILVPVLPLVSCAVEMPTIPAPWESTETQLGEPVAPSEAALPGWTKIGTSVRGKPIEAVTLGSGPRRVYIIGGVHGDEPEGPAAAGRMPAALLADMVGEAGARATVRIVRDMNPDGSASKTRGNTRGTDLNRNWPSRDFKPEGLPGRRGSTRALSELETMTIHKDMLAFKPDVVIVLRTAVMGRGPITGFNGPAKAMAFTFASAARGEDPRWRVSTERRYLDPGSVESLMGTDLKKPVLTLEFQRGREAEINAAAVRAGLLAMVAEK